MSAATWVAIIVPVLGFLGTVATILASRRQDRATAGKTSAEALQVVQETTLNLLGPMREQIAHLQASDEKKKREIKELQERVELVEDDRDVLASAIQIHVEWEDAGRPDPPGPPYTITDRVRAVLSRLHAA